LITNVSPEALARFAVKAANSVSCFTLRSCDIKKTISGLRTATASS